MSRPSGPPPVPGRYVPPAAYGDGAEESGRPLLPWLLLGGALLLGGLGLLAAVLLGSRGDGDVVAADPSTSGPAGSAPEQVARAWVEALRTGDYRTAFDLSCAQLRAAAAAGAPGADPADRLGGYFFDRVLDGGSFSAATLEDVDRDEVSRTDVVTFSLEVAQGPSVRLDVFVISDGTVCDFL